MSKFLLIDESITKILTTSITTSILAVIKLIIQSINFKMISVTILNLLVRKLKSLGVGFRRPIYTSHFGEVFRIPVASYAV